MTGSLKAHPIGLEIEGAGRLTDAKSGFSIQLLCTRYFREVYQGLRWPWIFWRILHHRRITLAGCDDW